MLKRKVILSDLKYLGIYIEDSIRDQQILIVDEKLRLEPF